MLMRQRDAGAVASGEMTLTFRRWKRPQVIAGRRYRTAAGRLEVEAVDVVDASSITDADARRAGYDTAEALRADLRGDAAQPVYRVAFRHVSEPDPRTLLASSQSLSDADAAELERRLDRLDRASPRGPWTAATLDAIAANPRVRAGDLAAALGRDRESFKLDVRKLKNLGLTISHEVGYELSPRGEAFRSRQRGHAR